MTSYVIVVYLLWGSCVALVIYVNILSKYHWLGWLVPHATSAHLSISFLYIGFLPAPAATGAGASVVTVAGAGAGDCD